MIIKYQYAVQIDLPKDRFKKGAGGAKLDEIYYWCIEAFGRPIARDGNRWTIRMMGSKAVIAFREEGDYMGYLLTWSEFE